MTRTRHDQACFYVVLWFIHALNVGTVQADPSAGHVKVMGQQQPVDVSCVKEIGGFVGQRLDANLRGAVKAFDIDRYLRMVEDKTHTDWWWIGEQPGKWLESAVWNAVRTSDPELTAKTEKVLARLITAQEPKGYLGITSPTVRTLEKPLRGMDPYELYFMMHGLLTAHEQFDNPKALACAAKLGDYFVKHIGPDKAEF